MWLHGGVKSNGMGEGEERDGMMVKKETPPGGVMADGQKYACRSFPKKFRVLEFVRYIRRKDDDRHKAEHSTLGEDEHKKYK